MPLLSCQQHQLAKGTAMGENAVEEAMVVLFELTTLNGTARQCRNAHRELGW